LAKGKISFKGNFRVAIDLNPSIKTPYYV
jgi:hypothetical protein